MGKRLIFSAGESREVFRSSPEFSCSQSTMASPHPSPTTTQHRRCSTLALFPSGRLVQHKASTHQPVRHLDLLFRQRPLTPPHFI